MPATIAELASKIDATSDGVAEVIGELDDREASLLRELETCRALRERYRDRIRRALAPKDLDS